MVFPYPLCPKGKHIYLTDPVLSWLFYNQLRYSLFHWVILLFRIFKTLSIPNRKNKKTLKTWIVINPKNLDCDKTQKRKFRQFKFWQNLKHSFGKNKMTPQQPMRFTLGSVLWCSNVWNNWVVWYVMKQIWKVLGQI